MFDIGFWELIILFGLGLVVLGPERLPKVAMQIGNWAGQARRTARNLTAQIRSELDIERSINGGYQPKTPAAHRRPGMDDLKPGGTPKPPADKAEADPPAGTDERNTD